MKFVTCLLLAVAFCGTASAGDRWSTCSNADGTVKLSDDVLTIDGIGEIAEQSTKLKVLSTVKEEETTCVLKDSGETVTVYQNVITVEEVQYTTEENDPVSTEIVICQRGVGALVPPEMCKE